MIIDGKAIAQKVDVSSERETTELAKVSIDSFGKIDILVNNAAYMAECSYKPLSAYTVEEWDRCFAVNVRGTWLCSKAVIPHMQEKKKGNRCLDDRFNLQPRFLLQNEQVEPEWGGQLAQLCHDDQKNPEPDSAEPGRGYQG